MLFVAVSCMVSFACGQHQQPSAAEQREYLDRSFALYDHGPHDGVVMETEWDASINREDLNGDGCVTVHEYLQVHSCPVAGQLFAHYDHDNDGCLKIPDMPTEFHLIDKSGNNGVSLHEWEQYFQHLVQKLFPHWGHQGR